MIWLGNRLKDLFYGQDNLHLELNRAFAGLGGLMMVGATAYDMFQRVPIDLGPGGLGGGLASIMGAAGLAISAKTWSTAKLIQAKKRCDDE